MNETYAPLVVFFSMSLLFMAMYMVFKLFSGGLNTESERISQRIVGDIYCLNCGEKINSKAIYCSNCGEKV